MVGFTRKKVKSYTLGEKLKRLREETCISLAEISKATKIRKTYLEKIEAGLYEELPAEVYIKGFLKGYAQYLGIDVGEVLKQYERERGVQENIKKHQMPTQESQKFRPPVVTITPKMFTAAAFMLLVFGGIFYFYREIGKFSETPRLVVVQPASDVTIDGSSIDIVGLTDKDSKVTINDQPVYVNESGEFNETLSLQQGVNAIVVKSLNRFGKQSNKAFNISSTYDATQIAGKFKENQEGGQAESQAPDKVSVEIRVQDAPIWVSVEVDGKNVQSGTMLAGSSQKFEADNQISVTSGKGNRTFIALNGQDIGPLGTSPGVVRDVIFTKDTKLMPEPTKVEEAPAPIEEEKKNDDDKDKKKKKP